jgi:hypothetical protein
MVKKRGSIVEHPFGTIKRMLGWDHFLVRGKEKVSGENALIMFAYNFKRVLNILGTAMFKKLLIAIKDGNIEQIVKDIQAYRRNIRVFIGYIFNNDFLCLYSTENRVYTKI